MTEVSYNHIVLKPYRHDKNQKSNLRCTDRAMVTTIRLDALALFTVPWNWKQHNTKYTNFIHTGHEKPAV